MKKLLINDRNDMLMVDGDNLQSLSGKAIMVSKCLKLEDDCQVIVEGKKCFEAKAGDVLIAMYGIESRWDAKEWYLIPAGCFGDYFERKAESDKKESEAAGRDICKDCIPEVSCF